MPETYGNILHTITCFTKWLTSVRPCLWMTKPFEDAPFRPNQDTVSCYQGCSGFKVYSGKKMYCNHTVYVCLFNVLIASQPPPQLKPDSVGSTIIIKMLYCKLILSNLHIFWDGYSKNKYHILFYTVSQFFGIRGCKNSYCL